MYNCMHTSQDRAAVSSAVRRSRLHSTRSITASRQPRSLRRVRRSANNCNCDLIALRSDHRCSHQFICLICSDSGVHSDCLGNCHTGHPRQSLVSDELLLSEYSAVECSEITIFGCPYCDRQQLSISTLYDHITLEHLDVSFHVRCPICVCFGGSCAVIKDIHLSEHLVEEHSVAKELYEEQVLAYSAYQDDENLLKFYACTLPPTYYDGGVITMELLQSEVTSPKTSANVPRSTNATDATVGHTCSICLDSDVFEANGRELSCKHSYHAGCIDLWLQRNSTCPDCRATVP